MNLKQLEAFVEVAEGGSFSRAAKNLYLTQPTISAHIAALEKELEVRLFVRNTKEVRERAMKLLSQMHVENAKDRLPSQVSGGEAQRAAIARAMMNSPGIIFADEPTGALNRSNSEEVIHLLSQINEKGQSILMVTHDIRAAIHGNRILYLEDGKIFDELELPNYGEDDIRARESKVNDWLVSLQW